MGTRLIENSKNGANLKRLTNQQRMFVLELLASDTFSPSEAATKAGYANPRQAAYKLLQQPAIAAALGKAQREREERCELKGDDVLNFLRAALFLNPLRYFYPSEDGGWMLADPQSLPEEVGRLIDSMEVKVVQDKDGNTTSHFSVKLVSKSQCLGFALKHLGLLEDKVRAVVDQTLTYPPDFWERIRNYTPEPNPIEERLAEEEAKLKQLKLQREQGTPPPDDR